MPENEIEREVALPVGAVELQGQLTIPPEAGGLVIFAHGSGSSRHSPRNRYVAEQLNNEGLGTLLFDLLTAEEEREDAVDAHLRFDIPLLADRLGDVTDWLEEYEPTADLCYGYFGSSTGAAAALIAAADRPDSIQAVVSRGGRVDLADEALTEVRAATLCIVGGRDYQVLQLNQEALHHIPGPRKLEVVPGASHLFEEPGALEEVARLAGEWFVRYLTIEPGRPRPPLEGV